jgi:hypothetical protein
LILDDDASEMNKQIRKLLDIENWSV